MKKKRRNKGFRCPEIVAPDAPDDFCILEGCCPPRLDTLKFPSPTSCLPEEETRELEGRIDAANELLLDLALSNERPEEGMMRSFEGLSGQWVEVEILTEEEEEEATATNAEEAQLDSLTSVSRAPLISESSETIMHKENQNESATTGIMLLDRPDINEEKVKRKCIKSKNKIYIRWQKVSKRRLDSRKKEQQSCEQGPAIEESGILKGRVHIVGKDFVLLKDNKKETLIPFAKIRSIKLDNRFAQPANKPELLNIDPCLRRSLTFNFGETVASSPELIQIFFKVNLSIFLLLQLNKKVKIKLSDEEIEGVVNEVSEESVGLEITDEKIREIPFQSIFFMDINMEQDMIVV